MNGQLKRQIVKPGDILAIPLKNGKKWMYLRKYDDGNAIYSLITEEKLENLNLLIASNVLLFTGIYRDVITCGTWPKVGHIPFESELETVRPLTFVYDQMADKFRYYSNGVIDGDITFEEAYDMEEVLVHEQWTLERILDHYIDTGFYHPRCWDICIKDYCINDTGKYRLKPEHREQGLLIRKKYSILQDLDL